MTEAKKKPPVMSLKQAEMRRAIRRNNVVRAWEREAEKEAKRAKTDLSKNGFSVSESPRGYLIWAPGREIIGSVDSSDQADMIVSALNGGDVTALKRWRRSPAGKKLLMRFREEIDLRLASA
ncbi:hypothetical protein [Nitrobacter sp.]|uniref:hypothetical protein n=1 Tax=Nitrobacter sp. TaxID=29420 RepID=UPI00399D6940